MQRCPRCQGSKKIAPMGGIYVQCTECSGIGYVELTKSESKRIDAQHITVTAEHMIDPSTVMETIIEPQDEIDLGTITVTNSDPINDWTEYKPKRGRKTHKPYNPVLNV